jgi:hypothetical protein
MSHDHNYLLDSIDVLTLPRKVRFVQTNEAGISCVSQFEHESLIEWLRDSITGNIGSHDGGSSDPTTRIPFDPQALAIYTQIEQQIGELLMGLEVVPGILPEQNLREWYRAFTRAKEVGQLAHASLDVIDSTEVEMVRMFTRWARQITSMFDPPKRIEVATKVQVPVVNPRTGERLYRADGSLRTRLSTHPAACPRCDQASAFDPSTGDRITALVIEYRQSEEEDALAAAVAVCRSCEWTWRGDAGIRELRMQIDEWEATHEPPGMGVRV